MTSSRMVGTTWKYVALAGVVAAALAAAQFGAGARGTATGEFTIEGKVFGMPKAEVFEDDYAGPPVVGEYLTLAPALAPLPAGNRVHDVRIDILVQQIEVAPGVRYDAWTFGGTVPGPVLHVREGDRVIFTMKNRSHEEVAIAAPARETTQLLGRVASARPTAGAATARTTPFLDQVAANNYQKATPAVLPMPHSMDFHSAMVAMDDKYRSIHPGESIRFEWVANYPGVYLYHCGTPPILQHVAMGQYGVVVVSPRDGYPTDRLVTREYVVVQSEFYLKQGPGEVHVLDYDAALDGRPSIVAFNGHQTSLVAQPLEASAGERVRLYLHNAGPTGTWSSHVVGTIFDRVWYEGNPANEWRGMQTALLGASNGAVVEFFVPEEGMYALVDHEFADATKGAVGRLVAGPRP